jgi:hypothetical protein
MTSLLFPILTANGPSLVAMFPRARDPQFRFKLIELLWTYAPHRRKAP